MLIPMAIVPIIVAVALFVGLRKVSSIRKVGIVNLIVASSVTLLILPTAVFHRLPFSWLRWTAAASFAVCWLVCAIGLFSRKRFAWFGSIVGDGILVCLLAAAFSAAVATIIYPSDDVLDSGPLLAGYVFSLILVFTWLGLALAFTIWLLFGLLRVRRDISSGGTAMPNTALEPTPTAPPVLTRP